MVGVFTFKLKQEEELGFDVCLFVFVITALPIGRDTTTRHRSFHEILADQHLRIDVRSRHHGRTVVTASVESKESFIFVYVLVLIDGMDIIVLRTIEFDNGIFRRIDNVVLCRFSGNGSTFCYRRSAAVDGIIEGFGFGIVVVVKLDSRTALGDIDIGRFIIGEVGRHRTLKVRRQLDRRTVGHHLQRLQTFAVDIRHHVIVIF